MSWPPHAPRFVVPEGTQLAAVTIVFGFAVSPVLLLLDAAGLAFPLLVLAAPATVSVATFVAAALVKLREEDRLKRDLARLVLDGRVADDELRAIALVLAGRTLSDDELHALGGARAERTPRDGEWCLAELCEPAPPM